MKQRLIAPALVLVFCVAGLPLQAQEGESILVPGAAEPEPGGMETEALPDRAPDTTMTEEWVEEKPVREEMIEKSGTVLEMPKTPAGPPPRISMPYHGMKMSEVERSYGLPRARHPAVGNPPITRWDYDGFSVFFEYSTVLHSVQEGRPAEIDHKEELQPATRTY